MLQHSESESTEKDNSESLKDARWSIGRFLLTTEVQCLSGLIEYVLVAHRKGAFEFVCPTEVLPNFVFERLAAIQEDRCTVIETVLLDNCTEHRNTNRLCVTVLERWMLQPIHKNRSSIHPVTSIDGVFSEIKRYCTSSFLSHWLKGHPHKRRHKLTHRICTIREASPQLSHSFLMERSELAGMFSFGDPDGVGGTDGGDDPTLLKQAAPSSIYHQLSPTKFDEAATTVRTTSFSPVHVDADRLLHVSVSSPQSLPTSAPHCPFCVVCATQAPNPRSTGNRLHTVPSDLSTTSTSASSSGTSSASLSSQSDVATSHPITDAISSTPSCDSWMGIDASAVKDGAPSFLALPSPLSTESSSTMNNCNPYTETVKSPMVVMTDAPDHFFSSDMWGSAAAVAFYHRFPSLLGTEFDATGSGSSTLTKKSRATTPPASTAAAAEPVDLPLESPPRKQQRMVPTDSGLLDQTQTTGDPSKQGTMDKVIDKFTQMNMQRDETCGVSGLLTGPTSSQPTACIQNTALPGATKRSHEAAHVESSAANGSPRDLTDQAQRAGRRRNASSICVSAWPSWTRENMPFFNRRTGLPLQSSPVPLKRSTSGKFDFDASLCPLKSSKSSTCMVYGSEQRNDIPLAPLASGTASHSSSIPNSSSQLSAYQANRTTSTTATNSATDISERSTKITTTATNGSCPPAASSPPSNQPRRRPASLRLTMPPATHPPFTNGSTHDDSVRGGNVVVGGGRYAASGRRRACPSDTDQAEMSSSAPPSGNRSLRLVTDRLANTLACTPMSHASSQHLLVNFEESMLNGRIHPVGQVDGFTLELGASGAFFPAHVRIPMNAYFFDLSDDNTPSPYLGYADLSRLRNGKGYHVPKKGSVQLTLFNPNKFVVKMFVIGYDFEDMPPNSQTFLRQRTVYMPIQSPEDSSANIVVGSDAAGTGGTSTDLDSSSSAGSDRHSVPNLFWAGQGSRASSNAGTGAANLHKAERLSTAVGYSPGGGLISSALRSSLCSSSSCSSCCGSCCGSCSCSSVTSSRTSIESSNSSTCSLASQGSSSQLHANCSGSAVRAEQPAYLRYLVHLRFHTTRSGRLYLHTDLRLIFARDKFEFDPRVATYELRSFVDAPSNPRYSPKKWTKPRGSSSRGRATASNSGGPFVPHITSP